MSKRKLPAKKATRVRRRNIIAFILVSLIVAMGIFYTYRVFGPNTAPFSDHKYFYIRTGSTYDDVLRGLLKQGIIRNEKSFDWLAKKAGYKGHVRAGRYEIKAGMSNFSIVKLLHSGRQTPVRLVINKLRTKADFIQLVSSRLEADSLTLGALLNDEVYLRQFGLDTNTAMCAIIPDTYDFFWNTDAEKTFQRLDEERDKFWNGERKAKAGQLGLTPIQVMILASIIEEETNRNKEKPFIASVYLNRMKMGMRLSADPTVKFAIGDFSLKRIYSKYTQNPSPYNTYMHAGLPPGPICTPSARTIDAVLAAPKTDYLYFCARPDFSGYHVFAATFSEHLTNARKYQLALDSLHIQ